MNIKTIEIGPTPKFIPAHTAGDTEFGGHGPDVQVTAELTVRNLNQLWVRLFMRARETRKDWTTAEGSVDYRMYDGGLDGVRRITRLLSDRYSASSYRDTDHADDILTLTTEELVQRFVVTGDTKGKEAGTRTGVSAFFNPVRFEYEPMPQDARERSITVNDTPKFIPPHTGGDRDFGGNGPDVNVSASISVENNDQIWATVWLRAIETRSDYTEAEGSTRYMIYRHDRPIRQILSAKQASAFYRDYDHADDQLTLSVDSLVRRFIVTGDTDGAEAGTRTGVVVSFNPIRILEG